MSDAIKQRAAVVEQVAVACRKAGLRVIGSVDPITGMAGVVVAHPFTSDRLDELDEAIYRTVPTGRDHTIVVLRETPVLVVTWWEGDRPYCEMCSHYHAVDEACRCPECGDPEPCNFRGGSH